MTMEKGWPRCSGPVALLQGQQGLHHADISSALIHGITWRWSAELPETMLKTCPNKGGLGEKERNSIQFQESGDQLK